MESPNDLICLSYCSKAAFPASGQGIDPQVSRILAQSRQNNRASGVGGVLHFERGWFFQYIEGPAQTVDSLYARICRDSRHEDVRRLTRRPIRSRRFRDWSMKFVMLDQAVEAVLRRHGLERFDPCLFTPAVIDDLVMTCALGPECAPEADPDAPPASVGRRWREWSRRVFGR